VGPVLGKLSVGISEGRGLRPSVDPYVVCQFQWAEFISEGPRNNEQDGHGSTDAVPMKRTDSEGRPRAIPMKSRQSSHTGLSDMRELRISSQVTDPIWRHEAIL